MRMLGLASIWIFAALGSVFAAPPVPTQTMQVGRVMLEIPSSYEFEDDEGTLVAWPAGTESIVVRVTAQTLLRANQPVPGAGVSIISKGAAKKGLKLERSGEAVWYHAVGPANHDSPPGSLIHLWNVGFGAHGLVISCYIDASARDQPQAKDALTQVLRMIGSLREAGISNEKAGKNP